MRVNTSKGDTGPVCMPVEVADTYISRGEPAGVILEDGKARIEFCSNRMGVVRTFKEMEPLLELEATTLGIV